MNKAFHTVYGTMRVLSNFKIYITKALLSPSNIFVIPLVSVELISFAFSLNLWKQFVNILGRLPWAEFIVHQSVPDMVFFAPHPLD